MSFYKNKKEENYHNKFKATLWITLHCKLSVILLFVWIQYLPVEMKGKPLYSGILQTKGKIKLYSCEYVHICMNHKTQFYKQNRMESGDTNWGAPGNVLSMCSKVSETSFEFRNIALYFFFPLVSYLFAICKKTQLICCWHLVRISQQKAPTVET